MILAAIALAAGGLFSTLEMGDRTELRLRATTGPQFAVDIATMPYLQFETKTHHLDFKFDYAAMVTQPDLEQGLTQGPQLFQLANVSSWYASRHWVIGASQAGGYGEMNFSYLSPTPIGPGAPPQTQYEPPSTNLIPCLSGATCASEVVRYGTSSTFGMVRWTGDRTAIAIAPSFNVGGGTDAASQALVPIVAQPRVDFAVEHRVTRRDVVITEGDATAADSTPRACDPTTGGPLLTTTATTNADVPLCAPREQWAGVREKWRRSLTRRLGMELSGGVTVARATINADDTPLQPVQPYKFVSYPTLRALFAYGLIDSEMDRPIMHPVITDPPKPSVYAAASLGPAIDTRYGFIDPRFEVDVGVLDPISPKYTLNAHAAFVRSVPPTTLDATYVAAWVELLRRVDAYRFEVGGGVRGAYQRDPFTGEFFVMSFYLTFVWHEPRIKL